MCHESHFDQPDVGDITELALGKRKGGYFMKVGVGLPDRQLIAFPMGVAQPWLTIYSSLLGE